MPKSGKRGTKLDRALGGLATDALAPTAKNFGKAARESGQIAGETLVEIAKIAQGLVRVSLAPFEALIWGYEQVKEKVIPRIISKVEQIPESRKILPSKSTIGSALDGAKFVADEPVLAEMFARLCASAFDSDFASQVHPAFVEIIRQLSSDEAQLLSAMAVFRSDLQPLVTVRENPPPAANAGKFIVHEHLSLWRKGGAFVERTEFARSLENFRRLGLVDISYFEYVVPRATAYDGFELMPYIREIRQDAEILGRNITLSYG